ncbi:MAG: hypothetical protein RLO81_14680 [Fulvivirga sp.]|uniref:hypothetical protein n=1 Tax=Fulvivirga sp. TaxID=1931237 RepID=UPI0032EE5E45
MENNKGTDFMNLIVKLGVYLVLFILSGLLIVLAITIVFPPDIFQSFFSRFERPDLNESIAVACFLIFLLVVIIFIFDSIGVIDIKHGWITKGIWGIGISSIIGTSVAVFSTQVNAQDNEFSGLWTVRVFLPQWEVYEPNSYQLSGFASESEQKVILYFDPFQKIYQGYSDLSEERNWFELKVNIVDTTYTLKRKIFQYLRKHPQDSTEATTLQSFDNTFEGKLTTYSEDPYVLYDADNYPIMMFMAKGGVISEKAISEIQNSLN